MNVRISRALLGVMALGLAVSAAVAAPKKKPAKPAPKKPAVTKPDPKAGLAAFKAEGCKGCHKTKDYADGGEMKDLSNVGADHKEADIAAFIKKPTTPSMQPWKGSEKTLKDLAAYLATQK